VGLFAHHLWCDFSGVIISTTHDCTTMQRGVKHKKIENKDLSQLH
jgi:hypothetical protein